MSGPHPSLAFVVLLQLKDGRVLRCSNAMGLETTRVFCRDLKRWLIGAREIGYTARDGQRQRLPAAQIASIDLMLAE